MNLYSLDFKYYSKNWHYIHARIIHNSMIGLMKAYLKEMDNAQPSVGMFPSTYKKLIWNQYKGMIQCDVKFPIVNSRSTIR
jgi:hypothetical protein